MNVWRVVIACSVVLMMVVVSGCSDEVGGGSTLCPDDNCPSCDGEDDCDDETYCHEEGICVDVVCAPGSSECDGGSVIRCNSKGSATLEPDACTSGVCEDGQCGCGDVQDCADGEACTGGRCVCSSEVHCGDDGVCCGDDDICAQTELCDDDGECEQFSECRPECEGSTCGFDGELCCDGDTPECGPRGECAPDCSNGGGLCGEDFDECCAFGEACVFGECRMLGESCQTFSDCDFGEYCDGGLNRCMPDDFPDDLICEIEHDFDPFDIEDLWHWSGEAVGDRFYENVQSIPVTADMTGNGTPEIVITPYHGNDQHNGILLLIDGVTGKTVYYNAERTFSGQGHNAVADVTGDGRPEIAVALGDSYEGVALVENPQNCPDPTVDAEDCIRWEVRTGTLDRYIHGMGPVIADLNGDGNVEVIVGTMVIDGDSGEVIADGTDSSRAQNGLENWGGSTVADLDGNGTLELLTGDCAWKVNFDDGELEEYWCNDAFNNGIPAVADIVLTDGRAGLVDVAVVRHGTLYILNGQTGETIYTIDVPGGGDGGAPNIADFDGDGTVEIGLPGATCYSVFDLACLDDSDESGECEQPVFPECTRGEDCIVDACEDSNLSGGSGDGILWSIEVHDGSMTTGSSVFDFQGNARNEVVYNDECRLLVLDGQSGQPLISRINTTRTATEYPLVVDVNGDGRSNIAVIANNDQFSRDCEDFLTPGHSSARPDWFPECFPEDIEDRPEACNSGTSGIFALQDVNNAWVSTRAIWNQHAYHITNINDDATLPDPWQASWQSHNTFRANRQGEVPLNAPDVVISSVQANALSCPVDIEFRATIENMGVAGIPADMPVSLYYLDPNGEFVFVESRPVGVPISPGGVAIVDFTYQIITQQINQAVDFLVVANDDGEDGAPVRDCNPDNASALVEAVVCEYQL